MATFVLIHAAGGAGWDWHLLEPVLRARGHRTVAPDLPGDDDTLTLVDYRDAVLAAVGLQDDLVRPVVVVAHSFGAFTGPLVADRLEADAIVLVAAMVPAPGERPDDWWDRVGYAEAVAEQAAADGGLTGNEDPFVEYYHDVPRALAEQALARDRAHPSVASGAEPWPLDAWPQIRTGSIVCTEDRLFPPALLRRLARERLGVEPDEIAAGHCVALSRPDELADLLEAYA
jgi:pimeloyl-ACP methyl ester carboxylesterase